MAEKKEAKNTSGGENSGGVGISLSRYQQSIFDDPAGEFFTVHRPGTTKMLFKRGFVSTPTSQAQAAFERRAVAERNAALAYQERLEARQAAKKRANIQAAAAAAAASTRAGAAATASSRLLTEFEAGRAQRRALAERQAQQRLGAVQASFGAAGVQSTGALRESERQSALVGNIQQSQENIRREQILQQGRSAIANALGTAKQAYGQMAAASQYGRIFQRETAKQTGFTPLTMRVF